MKVSFWHPIEGHTDPCDGRQFHNVKAVLHDSRSVNITLANDQNFRVACVLHRDGTIAYKIDRGEVGEMFGVDPGHKTEVYAVMKIEA